MQPERFGSKKQVRSCRPTLGANFEPRPCHPTSAFHFPPGTFLRLHVLYYLLRPNISIKVKHVRNGRNMAVRQERAWPTDGFGVGTCLNTVYLSQLLSLAFPGQALIPNTAKPTYGHSGTPDARACL